MISDDHEGPLRTSITTKDHNSIDARRWRSSTQSVIPSNMIYDGGFCLFQGNLRKQDDTFHFYYLQYVPYPTNNYVPVYGTCTTYTYLQYFVFGKIENSKIRVDGCVDIQFAWRSTVPC